MPFLIALLAGALSVLAYAPFGQFWLMPLSWMFLYVLLREESVRPGRGFVLGWLWGIGAMFAGLCWLVVALNRFGGMSAPLSVFLILLFSAGLALYPALAAAVFVRLRSRVWGLRVLLAAACWIGAELLRGQLFPSFPWLAIGYTQTPPSPLAGWAPVLGVYGVGFLLLLLAAMLVEAWMNSHARRRALLLSVLLCVSGFGLSFVAWTQPVGAPVRVALIQTNVAQDQKWRPELMMEHLQENLDLLRQYPAQISVLPESSLPMLEDQLPQGYMEAIEAQARAAGGDAVLGMFTRDAEGHIFNSSVTRGVSPSQRYSKNHLVPFGEYQPWGFGWFFKLASIPMADQTSGGAHQPLLLMAGQKIAMNICYEDVFGEELRRALPEATLMLNVSNLAWYGDSHAQPQHLQMSRMRALESGRPQLRSTNTGMTGIVMPDGSVDKVLAPFTQGAVVAEVRGYQGRTPFIWVGDWPVKIACALILVWALGRQRRR
ncbi:apolipoprotein N-acyltransferase [Uliginosibacterium flavum]|uniref:Apolipoprotein N-acyltransferase n=1 Tax=Uliginosibacterium flavum TaxID=1396831 RepID=A0ABV2TRZ0_9RHOO